MANYCRSRFDIIHSEYNPFFVVAVVWRTVVWILDLNTWRMWDVSRDRRKTADGIFDYMLQISIFHLLAIFCCCK